MATPLTEDDSTEELLTCQICMESFDDNIRLPKILGCMHTFCEQCIQKMGEGKSFVLCPYCKNTWQVPQKGFPNNSLVKRQLQNLRLTANPVPRKPDCENCPDEDAPMVAIGFCNDCQMYVCKTCVKSHKLMRVTKDHEIGDLSDDKILLRRGSGKSRCQRHTNQLLTVFCSTCNATLCNTCCITTHDGHKRTDLQVAVETTLNNLATLAEQSREKRTPIYSLLSSIDTLLDDLDRVRIQKEQEIEELFHSLEERLKDRCMKAKSEVGKLCQDKKEVLQDQRDQVKGVCAEYESASEFAEQMCKLTDSKQLMDLQQQVTDRLKELIDRENKATNLHVPLANNYIPFHESHTTAVEDFDELITRVGGTKSVSTLPLLCQTEQSSTPSKRQETGAIINGRLQKLKIFAMCFDGEPRKNERGGDPFTACLTSPDGSVTACTVEDNDDGTYTVFYTPQVSGPHTLDVRVFDIPIAGSPFAFKSGVMKYIPVNLKQAPVVEADWQEAPIVYVPHCIDLNIAKQNTGEPEAKVDIIDAKIRTDDNDEIPCRVIREKGDAKIMYTPTKVGKLNLMIKVNGQTLVDPIEIIATSLENSLISWQQQAPPVVGQRWVMTVDLKDHAKEKIRMGAVSLGLILIDSNGDTVVTCKPRQTKFDSKHEFECICGSSGTQRVDLQVNRTTVKTASFNVLARLNFTMSENQNSFPTSVETSLSGVIFMSDTKLGSICARSSENKAFPTIKVDTERASTQIAIDEQNSIFLLVPEKRHVLVYTTKGRKIGQWDCDKDNTTPVNIATSKHGQGLVAIGDAARNSTALFLYQKSGTLVSSIPLPSGALMDGLDNVCVDNQHCILVCNYSRPEIIKIKPDGEQVKTFRTPSRNNQLSITTTPENWVLVSEKGRINLYDFQNGGDIQNGKAIEIDDHIYTSISATIEGCVIALDVGQKLVAKYGYLHL